jgi:hypothetical protein
MTGMPPAKSSSSLKIVADLCGDHGLLYFPDTDGQEAVVALQHGTEVATLSQSDFEDGSLECGYTSSESVFNDFIIRYGYNPTSNEYTKSLYCNKDGQNIGDSSYQTKCSNSYNAIRDVHFKEFLCKWINDTDAAKVVLKWLIDWTHLPRLIVSGTSFMDSLKYEIGDLVKFDLPHLLKDSGTDPESPVFMLFDIKLRKSKGRVALRFLEVKEP